MRSRLIGSNANLRFRSQPLGAAGGLVRRSWPKWSVGPEASARGVLPPKYCVPTSPCATVHEIPGATISASTDR
jgi:hypothetical protein